MKSGHLRDAVGRTRIERRLLILRRELGTAKHFACPGKVKPALWHQVLAGGQQVVGAVNIDVHGRELIVKGVVDVALRRHVVHLVGRCLPHRFVDGRITLQGAGEQPQLVAKAVDPLQPAALVLQGDSANQTIDLISLGQQQFRQIAAILSRDAGNQSLFFQYTHLSILQDIIFA